MFGLPSRTYHYALLYSVWGESCLSGVRSNKQKARTTESLDRCSKSGSVNTVRQIQHFAWTRRLIALSAVFAIIVLPKLVAVWYPEVTVIVGYTEMNGGFWNWLFGPAESTMWVSARGFVITPPRHTHRISHCRTLLWRWIY